MLGCLFILYINAFIIGYFMYEAHWIMQNDPLTLLFLETFSCGLFVISQIIIIHAQFNLFRFRCNEHQSDKFCQIALSKSRTCDISIFRSHMYRSAGYALKKFTSFKFLYIDNLVLVIDIYTVYANVF